MDPPLEEHRHLWSALRAGLRSRLKAAWQTPAGTLAPSRGQAASSRGGGCCLWERLPPRGEVVGAGGNKHCGTERARQRWLVSAKARDSAGAMDMSGSSFGKVNLQISFPWVLCGASDDGCGTWPFLQAHLPPEGSLARGCQDLLCPWVGARTQSPAGPSYLVSWPHWLFPFNVWMKRCPKVSLIPQKATGT